MHPRVMQEQLKIALSGIKSFLLVIATAVVQYTTVKKLFKRKD
jgi:hypothetical protein